MLATTIAGSLPKPSWLAEPETLWAPWRVARESLQEAQRDAVRLALADQEAAGIDVLQLDEPAFNVYMDDVAAWGIEALHRAIEGLPCMTAVHICYGYGIKANVDWKKTLGAEWRQYERTFPLLAKSRIDQISLECANSRVPLPLLELLRGKDVMAGVIDVATREVETAEQVAQTIRAVMRHVDPARLLPCTNCGMVPLPRDVARAKLAALGAGARLVRHELARS